MAGKITTCRESNGWTAQDGCLAASGTGADQMGYIITEKQYDNFELVWGVEKSLPKETAVFCTMLLKVKNLKHLI